MAENSEQLTETKETPETTTEVNDQTLAKAVEEYYSAEDFADPELDEDEPPIDFSEWTQARTTDLDVLRIKKQPEEITVPIDYKNKKYVTLWIRAMNIDEQLRLLEQFFVYNKKGDVTMKWLPFYRAAWIKMVKDSKPRLNWQTIKYYGPQFLPVLMKYLPNPFTITGDRVGNVSEKEAKNLQQSSG